MNARAFHARALCFTARECETWQMLKALEVNATCRVLKARLGHFAYIGASGAHRWKVTLAKHFPRSGLLTVPPSYAWRATDDMSEDLAFADNRIRRLARSYEEFALDLRELSAEGLAAWCALKWCAQMCRSQWLDVATELDLIVAKMWQEAETLRKELQVR